VRFGELRGLTSLPIDRLRDQFRHEDVLTVLPLVDAATGRETLLVATRQSLAVLIPVRVPPGEWMTRWAPWDTVAIPEPPTSVDEVHQLTVLVGSQRLGASLQGEPGRRALRDFVAALRMARPAKAGPP
jgi:hypothetical protein